MLVINNLFLISRCHEKPNHIVPNIVFNNQAHNPILINIKLCMLVIVSFVIIIITLNNGFGGNREIWLVITKINLVLIFPSLFYCFNPRVQIFYARMFWDEAPDWLQKFNPNHMVEIQ